MADATSSTGNGSPPERVLPHDDDAERAVLGAALLAPQAAELVAGLDSATFYRSAHRLIQASVVRLQGEGSPVDMVTVVHDLLAHGTLESAGGTLHVAELVEQVPSVAAAPYYAQIVSECARRRRLLVLAGDAVRDLYDPTTDPETVITRVSEGSGRVLAHEDKVMTGAAFALGQPDEVQAMWGAGQNVLWSSGEPLLLVAPPGAGKTTLSLRLVLSLLWDEPLLGFPVAGVDRPILYIAADRPRQIARRLRQMIRAAHMEPDPTLEVALKVWRGPLEFDIAREPERFTAWVRRQGGPGTVFIDSLKDVAGELTKDETGSGLHRAFSLLVSEGVEVVANHHQRKATPDNRMPRTLADVYGSAWITAGAGSVLLLWGDPGDPILDLHHLKQPAEDVGPLRLKIDGAGGITRVDENDPLLTLRAAHKGLSAHEAAREFFDTTDPSPAQVEKARRKLEHFEALGLAHAAKGTHGRGHSSRWHAVAVGRQEELIG